ncbi:pyranose oxidase [Bradyrhizobium sp. Arg237L]|uniref:pyranose oxidase n=1 Tax=Bradyrhizobium sp. Arg237L TaxID=3003352 RepID=UPI00249EAA34|nr:pyranose oxidase [Bradyrhizobium sp. Arg237L]MDI4232498.1 pyranose oxidase [Bradyrhizobium sp. Arg237L]
MSRSPRQIRDFDVLVVGSGPVGCAFARTLVDQGMSVLMVDSGASQSQRFGSHLKNAFLFQRDINPFVNVIRGHLHALSVPPNENPALTLDPGAFTYDLNLYKGFIGSNQNPRQDPRKNLPGAAATYAVGGMATHWTCATPRQHPDIEQSPLLSRSEWEDLYGRGEKLLNTHHDIFEDSIRNTIVRDVLRRTFPQLKAPFDPQNLPLAAQRNADNDELVTWSGADTVLGDLAVPGSSDRFKLLSEHRCTKLVLNEDGDGIAYADVMDLINWQPYHVHAKTFVVCAGTVLTAQILYNSGIRPRALGTYLTEQPMAFCQIVLSQSIIDGLPDDPRFADKIRIYRKEHPNDPIPIPMNDPDPQLTIPVSADRPWHTQIHRDAFAYGGLPPNIDNRLIVDLRWFGIVEQREENKVTFANDVRDTFGMPQPTFDYSLSKKDREAQHAMMEEMLKAATALGGFLPGSEPQFMAPGLTLHIHGTTRIGNCDDGTSVADTYSRVWKFNNLYLGGNGMIPTAIACNPTLTSVALALRACDQITKSNPAKGTDATGNI